MWEDEIIQALHQQRETHAQQFNFELQSIYQWLIEEQKRQIPSKQASFAPKKVTVSTYHAVKTQPSF